LIDWYQKNIFIFFFILTHTTVKNHHKILCHICDVATNVISLRANFVGVCAVICVWLFKPTNGFKELCIITGRPEERNIKGQS